MTEATSEPSRVWLITGTSSGMGQALARAALERGDRVVATARNTAVPEELVTAFPGRVRAVELDVRDEAAVASAVDQAVEAFGGIDVVFNNAGYALVGSVEGTSDQQARDLFDTCFFGVLHVLRAVLPVMRGQRSGHVLQMSSIFAHMSFPATGVLAAAKQAVGGVTQAMAMELAPSGVKFTQIEPGGLRTEFLRKWTVAEKTIGDYEESVEPALAQLRNLPPEAVAVPARVAAAILEVVDAEEPPLHLALGGWAEDIIRKEIDDRLTDLENWSALTRSVDEA